MRGKRPMLSGEHILIIEDDAEVVDAAATSLAPDGYVCHLARDGQARLAKAWLPPPARP